MKKCKQCGQEKELDQYYTYRKYGKVYYTGRCKPCKLSQNKEYRDATGYDKQRYRRDRDRLIQQQRNYAQSEKGREVRLKASRKYRETELGKLKQRARSAVNHGLRDGKIVKPKVCMDCGRELPLEAHHKDYNKPLDVDWICKECHENRHHLNEGSTSE